MGRQDGRIPQSSSGMELRFQNLMHISMVLLNCGHKLDKLVDNCGNSQLNRYGDFYKIKLNRKTPQ